MSSGAARVLAAELTWTGERFERGIRVHLGPLGRIAAVDREGEPTRELPGTALLPGFVNAHSHAFQRGLRGRGERFPEGAGSFWSWRREMYALVEALDADGLHALSRRAFEEMLACGITAVGEFHYLHHERPGDWALDDAVLRAARDAGIRLVLLQAYYRTGGVGRPLEGAQRRFDGISPEAYWERADALAGLLDPATQSLGCVVHSIRAAELDDLCLVAAEARERGLVLHMHLEEQPREIEECRAAHGRGPLEIVLDELAPDGRFTAVHATHSAPADLERLAAAGASVCVCPLTEASLGDGIPDLEPFLAAGGRVTLGTDSNARISMLEEMRWLELAQRLARRRRGVVVDREGRVSRRLLRAATADGARSLGIEAGAIRPGVWADMVAVDLAAPALAGVDEEALLDALVLGAGDDAIAGVFVGGRWRARGA